MFTDVTSGERHEADLIARVRFSGQTSYFLIHVENQASLETAFNKRMFRYFSRLHEKFDLPIYPIVIFSYDKPKKAAPNCYQVIFPDKKVLQFNYQVIQLNRLNWRDFLERRNPVASALMAKMNIAPEDRPKVKVECLRLLATLRLDPARMQLISGFVDTYLKLNAIENQIFVDEIAKIKPDNKEEVMQIVTSWMEEGIEQGLEQGRLKLKQLIVGQLAWRFGQLDPKIEEQISALSIAHLEVLGLEMLEFANMEDLTRWLAKTEAEASNSEAGEGESNNEARSQD
ncbi:MAG: Rpn family recombination-promoting nuclease/putative transposase [Spirulina sp.]